jgi:hypothetical protein
MMVTPAHTHCLPHQYAVFVPGESIRRFVNLIFEEDSGNQVIVWILYGFPSFPCLYDCQDCFRMLVLFTQVCLFVWLGPVVQAALKTLYAVFLRSQTQSRIWLTHLLLTRKVAGSFLTEETNILVALSPGNNRSQWLRSLRRGSAAFRLLGLQVRIPSTAWMSASCECCVLSGRGLCVGLITRPEECYRVWCVCMWSRSLDKEEVLAL